MMIIMQFAFQVILLAVGFGVGYWLIITSYSQQGTLKTLGQALGGVLIIMALILELFSAYYSMKISNRGYMQGGCPMNRTMNPTRDSNSIDNNSDIDERSEIEQDTNTLRINAPQESEREASLEGKSRPVENNINDRN
jgi:hypothetical protein